MRRHPATAATALLLGAGLTAPTYPARVDASRAFWVSPTGSDNAAGTTRAHPFRTIERARDAVRAQRGAGRGGIVVWLRGGTYALTEPLRFGPADSGTSGHPIIYRAAPGERPVISGGRRVSGWVRAERGMAAAPWTGPDLRQLYVNGRRAIRARGPAPTGARPVGDWRSQSSAAGFHVDDAGFARWRNPRDVELGFFNTWSHMICKVAAIRPDPAGGAILTMQQPGFWLSANKEGVRAEQPAYIENALELLDQPGEWYLDRAAQRIYYMPRPGEEMSRVSVVAPVLEKLLEVRGSVQRPVHDLQFVGITFADATWLRPSRIGHADVQANFVIQTEHLFHRDGFVTPFNNEAAKSPANVVVNACRSIVFSGCEFTRLGGAGLDVECGSQDVVVSRCQFHDISGSAIQIGDVRADDHHPRDPRLIVKGNRVADCSIHGVGAEYEDSVGIFVGYTEASVLSHNEIWDLPYSGISVGWGWGEQDAAGGAYKQPVTYSTPTTARNNRIEFNHIHHVMRTRSDGGGIYTLGNMPGTRIRGNRIHDNVGAPGGIYTDEGSGFLEITGNKVYNVAAPYNQNNRAQGRDKTCVERDNAWGVKPAENDPSAGAGVRK